MRISCPYCGARSNDEFAILGDADALMRRPPGADQTAMHDYVYLRPNPAGWHRELWYHQSGCRQWLVVERNTLTHEVRAATPAREARPGGAA